MPEINDIYMPDLSGAQHKSLLAELATLTRNTIRLPGTTATFYKLAQPTTLQARALDLAERAPLDP